MKKRILASVVSLVMLFSILPTSVIAVANGGRSDNACTQAGGCGEDTNEERAATGAVLLSAAGDSMPTVGFKVQMNPHIGAHTERVYYDGQTVEVDLRDMTSAYIKPYIEGVDPPGTTPWEQHIYYTYELHNCIEGTCKDDEGNNSEGADVFGREKIYNKRNTESENWINANELADERLDTSYYQIVVKAYRSGSWGEENPESDTMLGTTQANLYVRMTWSKITLDWIDSYFWDKYYINHDLEILYDTPEELIAEHLSEYTSTDGCDTPEYNFLSNIPVRWALTGGTEWSVAPGALNTLTWTAYPNEAPDAAQWEVPGDFRLSQDIVFQNPFSVTFRDGETVIKTVYLKNNSKLTVNEFPEVPEKNGYISGWSVETDLTVTENMELTVVRTPIEYAITYDLNGGTMELDNPNSYTVESPDITLRNPSRNGYVFLGWTKGEEKELITSATISKGTVGNLQFTAHWDKYGTGGGSTTYYTLSYDSNGGTEYKAEWHYSNAVVKLNKAPTRMGYIFTGWYTDRALTNCIDEIRMTGNKTVYAGWKKGILPEDLNSRDHIAYASGYPDGTLRPDAPVSRSEATMMLYRLLTEARRAEIETDFNNFTDVKPTDWYTHAVSTMVNGGYISGYPDGTFGGDRQITRAEFAAMLARFINLEKVECLFTDVSKDHWAYEYIATATTAGWIAGYSDGTFGPDRNVTRAEVIAIINRVLNRGVDENSTLLNFKIWPDNPQTAWYYYEILEATNDHKYTGSRPSEDWTRV